MAIEVPYCSTDNVWRHTDTNRCLTDDLDTIEGNISSLTTGKANSNHTHTGFIKTIDANTVQFDKNPGGSFSGTISSDLVANNAYLLSIKYVLDNTLVDESVYVVYYNTSSSAISYYNLVKCSTLVEDMFFAQTSGSLAFSVTVDQGNLVDKAIVKII